MCQETAVGDLEQSIAYLLKRAATALRTAMDAVLCPLDLTVPQYACLELLGQSSGQSNADLARGAFVSRQAMNQVLRGLQDRGLLIRPPIATHGRALPTQLTGEGRRILHAASSAVARVEQQMLRPLTAEDRHRLRRDLTACTTAVADTEPRPKKQLE
ncbi:MAG: MarR family transcriptional regulator [Actinomycetota bacterium]|nr:MarR family transcriptional regulator [Actinomycetota bacterium]